MCGGRPGREHGRRHARERGRPLPPWLMRRDGRGAIRSWRLCCLVCLAVGILLSLSLRSEASADIDGPLSSTVTRAVGWTTIKVTKTAALVDGRQTYVYRPILADASAEAAIVTRIAELIGVEVGALAAEGEVAGEPEASACSIPQDLCAEQPVTAPVGCPGVDFLVARAYRPTPAITSVSFDLTRMDPGNTCQTAAGTLVFDSALGRAVELADLFAIDATTINRLNALLAELMPMGGSDGGVQVPSIDLDHFLLLAEGIGFYAGTQTISEAHACSAVVPYRALTGMLRARIGYPGSPDQSYPAYIEIMPTMGANQPTETAAGPVIALTFDDGPSDTGTHAVLAELSKRRAVATFCVIGVSSVRRQAILQDIVLQGSEIGNHTWRHWDLSQMPPAEVAVEITKVQRLVESATGISPAFVRPPAGHAGPAARRAFGLPAVYWSIDPYDWRGGSAEAIATHVIERARDGDIVLLHDTAPNTALATGMILDELGARGFRFVTVSELLDLASGKVPPGSIWRNRSGG